MLTSRESSILQGSIMNTHEYQAKEVLKNYNIPVPDFEVVEESEGVAAKCKERGWNEVVVKAQLHAGGRGKSGAIKIVDSPEEAEKCAKELFSLKIATAQSAGYELPVNHVMITPKIPIEHEYYLSCVIDRKRGKVVMIASPEGGVDIEQIAEETPEKILKVDIPDSGALPDYLIRQVCSFMGWSDEMEIQASQILSGIAQAFQESDALLLEINPLVTSQGQLMALDAKMNIDDNALFRQPQIASYYDPKQLTQREVRAHEHDLSYIAMEGDVGCMVNGAGLAMATMDLIHVVGGEPANFLDVGGSATEERIAEGFQIITSDSNVKSILVNIFGGIMNCATIAKGVISAIEHAPLSVPLIIRMEGNNVEAAKEIINKSGIKATMYSDLKEAAHAAVQAAK